MSVSLGRIAGASIVAAAAIKAAVLFNVASLPDGSDSVVSMENKQGVVYEVTPGEAELESAKKSLKMFGPRSSFHPDFQGTRPPGVEAVSLQL